MAKFNGYILTEKGRELLAKGLSGGKIEFTKMQIGDGTSSVDARSMTALVNPKKDLALLNINTKGGQCELTALLSNQDLITGFYIKELGVFAKGDDEIEILYAYNISTNPDFIPPFSANNIVEIEYVDTIIVDQVTNITAVIDPSITYITKKYADENYLMLKDRAELMGAEFGGLLSTAGTKKVGTAYFDSVNKQMVVPTVQNELTYYESTKFIPISDYQTANRLENLFEMSDNYIKYSNGLMIIFGGGTANSNGYINTLPISFKKIKSITLTVLSYDNIYTATAEIIDSNKVKIRSNSPAGTNISVSYTIFATWK